MLKKAALFVREVSFVSRFRTGCGMFARYASRFTGIENAAWEKARRGRRGRAGEKSDFFSILLELWRLYANSPHHEMSLLFPQRNFDHQPAHDVIQFKVLLRAVRMGIVTAYAGLADGEVSVDGLEIGLIADLDRTGGRPFWMFTHSF
jgi:hypothetical protein